MSGTITLKTGTYTSNTDLANDLEEVINSDTTLKAAGKKVAVLWDGSSYQIVSKNSTSNASISINSIDSSIESHFNITAANGGRQLVHQTFE